MFDRICDFGTFHDPLIRDLWGLAFDALCFFIANQLNHISATIFYIDFWRAFKKALIGSIPRSIASVLGLICIMIYLNALFNYVDHSVLVRNLASFDTNWINYFHRAELNLAGFLSPRNSSLIIDIPTVVQIISFIFIFSCLSIFLILDNGKRFVRNNIKNIIEFNPDLYQAHYLLGQIVVTKGRYEEAIQHYQDTLRLRPNDEKAENDLRRVLTQYEKKL